MDEKIILMPQATDDIEIINVDEETAEITVTQDAIRLLQQNELAIKEAKERNEMVKRALKEAMETYNITKIESDILSVSYIAEHESTRLDSKKVEEEYPAIYRDCLKTSNVKSSVRVNLKKGI